MLQATNVYRYSFNSSRMQIINHNSNKNVSFSGNATEKVVLMTREQALAKAAQLGYKGDHLLDALKLQGLDRFHKIFKQNPIPQGYEKYYLTKDQLNLISKRFILTSGNYFNIPYEHYIFNERTVKIGGSIKEIPLNSPESSFGELLQNSIYYSINGLFDKSGNINFPKNLENIKYSKVQCSLFASQFMRMLSEQMLKTSKKIGQIPTYKREAFKLADLARDCLKGSKVMLTHAEKQDQKIGEIPEEVIKSSKNDILLSLDKANKYINALYADKIQ